MEKMMRKKLLMKSMRKKVYMHGSKTKSMMFHSIFIDVQFMMVCSIIIKKPHIFCVTIVLAIYL